MSDQCDLVGRGEVDAFEQIWKPLVTPTRSRSTGFRILAAYLQGFNCMDNVSMNR